MARITPVLYLNVKPILVNSKSTHEYGPTEQMMSYHSGLELWSQWMGVSRLEMTWHPLKRDVQRLMRSSASSISANLIMAVLAMANKSGWMTCRSALRRAADSAFSFNHALQYGRLEFSSSIFEG